MAAPYGYAPGSVLPSNVGPLGSFTAYKAPTTNDTVYTAPITSGQYKGQVLYVGPDNQPYVGAQGSLYSSQPGYINPTTKDTKITWASILGGLAVNNTVAASTYSGPGQAPDTGPGTFEGGYLNTPAGENLLVSQNASLAEHNLLSPGTYVSTGSIALGARPMPTAPPAPTPASAQPAATAQAGSATPQATLTLQPPPTSLAASGTGATGSATGTNLTAAGSTAGGSNPANLANNPTADPLGYTLSSLLGTGPNAYGPGGTDQSGTGPPATTAGLQDIAPVSAPNASSSSGLSGNSLFIIFILIAIGVAGYFAYEHHKKTGKWI